MTRAGLSLASLAAEIARLRQDFPGYAFWTQPTWDGMGIAAIRSDGVESLHTLITPIQPRYAPNWKQPPVTDRAGIWFQLWCLVAAECSRHHRGARQCAGPSR